MKNIMKHPISYKAQTSSYQLKEFEHKKCTVCGMIMGSSENIVDGICKYCLRLKEDQENEN